MEKNWVAADNVKHQIIDIDVNAIRCVLSTEPRSARDCLHSFFLLHESRLQPRPFNRGECVGDASGCHQHSTWAYLIKSEPMQQQHRQPRREHNFHSSRGPCAEKWFTGRQQSGIHSTGIRLVSCGKGSALMRGGCWIDSTRGRPTVCYKCTV